MTESWAGPGYKVVHSTSDITYMAQTVQMRIYLKLFCNIKIPRTCLFATYFTKGGGGGGGGGEGRVISFADINRA